MLCNESMFGGGRELHVSEAQPRGPRGWVAAPCPGPARPEPAAVHEQRRLRSLSRARAKHVLRDAFGLKEARPGARGDLHPGGGRDGIVEAEEEILASKRTKSNENLNPCWPTATSETASRSPQPARHFNASSAPSPDCLKHLSNRRAWVESLPGLPLSAGSLWTEAPRSPGAHSNSPSGGAARRPHPAVAKLWPESARSRPNPTPALGMWLWKAFWENVGPGMLRWTVRIFLPTQQLHVRWAISASQPTRKNQIRFASLTYDAAPQS